MDTSSRWVGEPWCAVCRTSDCPCPVGESNMQVVEHETHLSFHEQVAEEVKAEMRYAADS